MKTPFDQCSREYDLYRPEYPAALYDFLIDRCQLTRSSRIVDVGAGTGKASVSFLDRGFRTIAVEPSPAMREEGLRSNSGLIYLCATAEDTALQPGVFDVLISAQAFHWFDLQRALREFARVLKPSGVLAVFWNIRDLSAPLIQNFERLVKKYNPEHECGYRQKDWKSVIESSGAFRVIGCRQFTFAKPMSSGDWVGLARSLSYVRCLPDETLADFERGLRVMLAQHSSHDCPYITELWLAQKGVAK